MIQVGNCLQPDRVIGELLMELSVEINTRPVLAHFSSMER